MLEQKHLFFYLKSFKVKCRIEPLPLSTAYYYYVNAILSMKSLNDIDLRSFKKLRKSVQATLLFTTQAIIFSLKHLIYILQFL